MPTLSPSALFAGLLVFGALACADGYPSKPPPLVDDSNSGTGDGSPAGGGTAARDATGDAGRGGASEAAGSGSPRCEKVACTNAFECLFGHIADNCGFTTCNNTVCE